MLFIVRFVWAINACAAIGGAAPAVWEQKVMMVQHYSFRSTGEQADGCSGDGDGDGLKAFC